MYQLHVPTTNYQLPTTNNNDKLDQNKREAGAWEAPYILQVAWHSLATLSGRGQEKVLSQELPQDSSSVDALMKHLWVAWNEPYAAGTAPVSLLQSMYRSVSFFNPVKSGKSPSIAQSRSDKKVSAVLLGSDGWMPVSLFDDMRRN